MNGSVPVGVEAVVPRTPLEGELEAFAGLAFGALLVFGDKVFDAPSTPVVGVLLLAVVPFVADELLLVEELLLVDELFVVEELLTVELLVVLLLLTVELLFTAELFVVLDEDEVVFDVVDEQLGLLAGMLAFVGHGWQLELFAAIEWS